jgi:hypothetical protein
MDAQSEPDSQPGQITPPQIEVFQSPPETQAEIHHKKPKQQKKTILLIVAALIALGAVGYWGYRQSKYSNSTVINSGSVNKVIPLKISSYQFFQTPEKLGNLDFFANTGEEFGYNCPNGNDTNTTGCPPNIEASDISYYQIGLTAAKQPIVVAAAPNIYEGGNTNNVAIENTPNHYEIIGQLEYDLGGSSSNQLEIASFRQGLSANVTLDTTDNIAPLQFPEKLSVGRASFALPNGNPAGYFIDGVPTIRTYGDLNAVSSSAIKQIGTDGIYSLYEVTALDQPTYQVEEIYASIKGVYAAAYSPVDSLNSIASAPAIAWTDSSGSTTNASTYDSGSTGCSSPLGYVITNGLDPNTLIQVGTGPSQQPIYELPTSSPLFSLYYNDNYSSGTYLSDSSLMNLTPAQFQADHAVIVAENGLGEYVVYTRNDMIIGGGCGKPVIYLYPSKPTEVNVLVGAVITKSDPLYQKYGWQDVMAYPNGNLVYRSQDYGSLFWEGTGLGVYPLIDSGTIVPIGQASSVIRQQLSEQGLNTNEINAFLAYWQPQLPSTPFVRLSWLNTAQMNQLAPLRITPKPDTLIRVFLDFAGVDKPYPITPQTFSAPARTGFTVVEWGGLLRNK